MSHSSRKYTRSKRFWKVKGPTDADISRIIWKTSFSNDAESLEREE